jgi:3-hydroxyacyl-CoA dehydrogenase
MKLLEVVRGRETAADALATVMEIARRIRKVPVLSRVCYGFIGNRMLGGYMREAQMLLLEGCAPAQVDGALERFGMAMGPIAVGDLAGLSSATRRARRCPMRPTTRRTTSSTSWSERAASARRPAPGSTATTPPRAGGSTTPRSLR